MLEKFRERRNDESGFTLVELLVVMLILGILAAIAIPSFFAQRDKATDADAKSAAKTAQTSIETYATDNGGSYLAADPAKLKAIEPTLPAASPGATPGLSVSGLAAKAYTVTVSSTTGNTFSVARAADGSTSLTCTVKTGETAPFAGCGVGNKW